MFEEGDDGEGVGGGVDGLSEGEITCSLHYTVERMRRRLMVC